MKEHDTVTHEAPPTPDDRPSSGLESTTVPGAARASQYIDDGPLKAGALVDRYVILHPLGKGGMGVVYAAFDPQLDRKVAIKILRPDRSDEVFKQRLLREAQAMARVSHPNVLRVFDAGVVGDLVFLAMEYVEGETLAEWLLRTKPAWREALRVFVEAGRGLAAAHAAGLVHRDFKPANVLLGADNSIRVTDFGLARADAAEAETPQEKEQDPITEPTPLRARLTQAGAFIGTPGYMAPEQLAGKGADARADQFAFCVATYEAIFDSAPFPADSVQQLSAAIALGNVSTPSKAVRIPGTVRKALLRGLRHNAGERWPSMDALLTQMNLDPGAKLRRRLLMIAAVEALAVVTLSWRTVVGRSSLACRESDRALTDVWSSATKDRIHAAFAATHAPYAEDAWTSVEARLNGYAAEWRAMRIDTCEATQLRHTQSGELMDLRMGCLDRRLNELSSLTTLFSQADARVVQGSVAAAHALPALDGCADAAALRAVARAPQDALTRQHIADAREAIANAKELEASGDSKGALNLARNAAQAGRDADYAPVVAEASLLVAAINTRLGDRKAATASLQDAVYFAEVGQHDAIAARAWTQLARIRGLEEAHPAEGEMFARYAEAAIQRLGGSADLEADQRHTLGLLLQSEGRYDEAQTQLRAGLELRSQQQGSNDTQIASDWVDVASTFALQAAFDKAADAFQRALDVRLKLLGPSHPDTAAVYYHLASLAAATGDGEKAAAMRTKSVAIAPDARTDADWLWGQVRWNAGKDRSEAVRLVKNARDGFAHRGDAASRLAAADLWLADHRE